MNARTTLASIVTLGVLSSFLVAIVLGVMYFFGSISWQYFVIGIIAFNLLSWLVSPIIQDLINRWLYKTKWLSKQELQQQPYYSFIKQVCDDNNIPVPKVGVIDDRNPTAYTYGSAAFNARIVITKGLSEFLNEEELHAVLAHELGHIRYRDFITMTVASTILQLLYVVYQVCLKSNSNSSSSDSKGRGPLIVIGLASMVFYYIGTFLVLFLSRVREYAADAFAAKYTSADALSSALLKIAYGILTVPNSKKTQHLLRGTRAQGIYDLNQAYKDGLTYQNADGDSDAWSKAMLFDLTHPWAKLYELVSTHPLVAKRIKALSDTDASARIKPDMSLVASVDSSRQTKQFFADVFMLSLPKILLLSFVGYFIFSAFQSTINLGVAMTIAGAYIVSVIIFTLYKYPSKGHVFSSVAECMSNPYVSPIRGSRIQFEGEVIGKGVAGAVFSEDLKFRDSTGLMYLNYVGLIPLFSNLAMAFKKFKKFMDKQSRVKGWFYRSSSQFVTLQEIATDTDKQSSHPILYSILGKVILIIAISIPILLQAL